MDRRYAQQVRTLCGIGPLVAPKEKRDPPFDRFPSSFRRYTRASSDAPKLNKLLYPFRSHLFFEIGANVLPGGKGYHVTILISALRHTVIFGPIKNSPKIGAMLPGCGFLH